VGRGMQCTCGVEDGAGWWTKGSRLLREENVDVAIVNDIVPLRFRPKIAVNHGTVLKSNKLHLFVTKRLTRATMK